MIYPGLNKIIDLLRNLDNSPDSEMGFDMNVTHTQMKITKHPCGTACCIGGHAALALRESAEEISNMDPHFIGVEQALMDWCELDKMGVSTALCWPSKNKINYKSYSRITIDHTIAVLEHCRDTGVVDWSIGLEKEEEESDESESA